MSVLTNVANSLINTLGPEGIAIGLAINAMGVPIPSEILLPLAGVGVKSGQFALGLTFGLAVLGQLVGLSLSYTIARFGGIGLIERYGGYVGFRRHELDKAQLAFDRYGGSIVLVGLCLPVIHGYVGYPAGVAKMNPVKFGLYATLGASIWAGVLMYLGYILSAHLDLLDRIFTQFSALIVILLAVGVIWYIRRRRKSGPPQA